MKSRTQPQGGVQATKLISEKRGIPRASVFYRISNGKIYPTSSACNKLAAKPTRLGSNTAVIAWQRAQVMLASPGTCYACYASGTALPFSHHVKCCQRLALYSGKLPSNTLL